MTSPAPRDLPRSGPPGRSPALVTRRSDGDPGQQTSHDGSTSATPAALGVALSKVSGAGDTRIVALDGVDVTFPRGHFTAIMGPSGSGGSTLMHCMAGLDALGSGPAWIGGTELSSLDTSA